MRDAAARALRELHKITNACCATCKPTPFGCCSADFCDGVARGLEATGRPVPPRGKHPTLRFMGENGCVVAPELRPGCSGYVCPERLARDRDLRRKHARLQEKGFRDSDATALLSAAANHSMKAIVGMDMPALMKIATEPSGGTG